MPLYAGGNRDDDLRDLGRIGKDRYDRYIDSDGVAERPPRRSVKGLLARLLPKPRPREKGPFEQ